MYCITKVSFAWWNTGLSPAGKSRLDQLHMDHVCDVIKYLIISAQVDFIALGEVNDADIAYLTPLAREYGYEMFNGYEKSKGRSYFDLCALYRKDVIFLESGEPISVMQLTRSHKLAQKLIFYIYGEEFPLHTFISHWPSRMRTENEAIRNQLGMRLRSEVEELLTLYKNESLVVLLGDYNDEPFDSSISDYLLSTRDKELAEKKSEVLYNPFWKIYGQPLLTNQGNNGLIRGTYYYKSDPLCKWKVFDQMIFSSSFLSGRWRLNERLTGVVDVPNLRNLVIGKTVNFDHFPIVSVIERINL